ncbi:hypothetical protein AURDEDRAFT_185418 [Auricularia subglabra TFB-10046 SS5]|nr:hypothetical protein AURDEDRAFT_185418 [Auricularia subglabra TFB-10046 SS5]
MLSDISLGDLASEAAASPAKPDDKANGLDAPVERARKAVALKNWSEAIEQYSIALEYVTEKHGEKPPIEYADLYFDYGKALLESAISSNAVLGKAEEEEPPVAEDKAGSSKAGASDARFHFGGDAEDDDDAVDLLGDAQKEGADDDDDEQANGGDENDDDEPEDDFNAAWEVLDVARTLYEQGADADARLKLRLADTLIALGDISLETEKFDQAIDDYSAGLKLKQELLPLASRHIAEAHFKLSIAYDLTLGRLKGAIEHVQGAIASVEARIAELRCGLEGQAPSAGAKPVSSSGKGKGKATATSAVERDDLVENMSRPQIETEIKELTGLKEELGVKLEELKTTPSDGVSAQTLLKNELDQSLGPATSSSAPAVINDLTGMVKRKKDKAAPAANGTDASALSGTKRKAEDPPADNGESKKARVEDVSE